MNTPSREQIENCGTSVVVRFPGPRKVLSTSWLNGGYRADLQGVFNHQIPRDACEACHSGGNILEYLGSVARDLGLDPETVSGMVTRADMKNTVMGSKTFRDLTVTAVVTAGIDKNGGRAGDPASYYEHGDSFEPLGGTINIILLIGADLPEYTMARAIMTATEAKAATLQQLVARSLYSTGIATGSGTDMIVIVSDPASPLRLSDAGKHSVLGELIGKTVIQAMLAALEKETGLSPDSQRDALVRLQRYRVTREDLWDAAAKTAGTDPPSRVNRKLFYQYLDVLAKRPAVVALVAAALHIVDEAEWGLISRTEACDAVCHILRGTTWADGSPCAETDPLQNVNGMLASHVVDTIRRDDRCVQRETDTGH